MSKPNKKIGPQIAAAVLCDAILQDKDGALSAIRIIDTINGTLPPDTPDDVPSEEKPVSVPLSILVIIRSADSSGRHKIRIIPELPSGRLIKPILEDDATLSPEPHGGLNIRLTSNVLAPGSGLYWLRVIIDGKILARMPFKINFIRTEVKEAKLQKSKK
jgi:hypothetical protein